MAYTPTTFVNNTTPAISAANLNKLTNEIKAQALAHSIVHTLPTWADGVAPAVSDATPLNEMERVIKLISTATGNAYTQVAWSSGWSPARNAANLNHMEQQMALTSVPATSDWYIRTTFDGGTIPAPWTATTFFNYQGANATYAVVADPLGQRGQVLRLRCPYTPGTMPLTTDYPSSTLQQAAIHIGTGDSRADQGMDTWYRSDFMIPSGNVFCNGLSNFMVEWHTQATGPLSSGLFAYGSYPLTTGGTTSPKLVFVLRSGNIGSPSEIYYPGGTGTVDASPGIAYVTNHWYKCEWHFIWSSSNSGLFEWFLDDQLIVSTQRPTHFTDPNEIFSYAVYNYRYHVSGDSNLYYDTMVVGPSRTSIQ